MPVVHVHTNVPVPEASATPLLRELSALAAAHFGKPEQWVMTRLAPPAPMTFAGSDAPAAYVEVKNIGRSTPGSAKRLSSAICEAVERGAGVPRDRIYVDMEDAKGWLWGWNGETFEDV
jgi:phenylpyruvate tautomerase